MLQILVLISILLGASSASFQLQKTGRTHAHHIKSFQLVPKSDPPSHLKNALHKTIDFKFDIEGCSFELDLELNTKFWAPEARIIGPNGEEPIQYRSYQGAAKIFENGANTHIEGSASVTFWHDMSFHAIIRSANETYHVDKTELKEEYFDELHGEDRHQMILSRASESGINPNSHIAKSIRFEQKLEKLSIERRNNRKLLQSISSDWGGTYFSLCYPGQEQYTRGVRIGIVSDSSFDTRVSSVTTPQYVAAMFADGTSAKSVNWIYENQVRIRITVGTLYYGSQDGTYNNIKASAISQSVDINTRLTNFASWTNGFYSTNKDNHAVWHLLTNAHPPPGTVGLAWIDVLCKYYAGYRTGVSNYIGYGEGTWTVVAHELGHNFNVGHAFDDGQGRTGGIMDYGNDGHYPVGASNPIQFNPKYSRDELCEGINNALGTNGVSYGTISATLCFYQIQGVTPQPTTPAPTPKPTNRPTPKPTPKPTTFPPTQPNDTPSPTPKPTTASPTPKPTTPQPTTPEPTVNLETTSSAGVYSWRPSADWTACEPSCGYDSVRTNVIRCYRLEVVDQNQNYYYYTLVDESYCDAALKPAGEQEICNVPEDVPACNPICGDGEVGAGEVCDTGVTSTGSCCADDCRSWKTTIDCFMVNPTIDAITEDDEGKTYVVQGQYYARYSFGYKKYLYEGESNVPDAGYPKLLSAMGLSSFDSLTALAYVSDSAVYAWKGTQFVVLDWNTNNEAAGPKETGDEFLVNPQFLQCGSVDGAIAKILSNGGVQFVLFCADIYTFIDTYKFWTYPSYNIVNLGLVNQLVVAVSNKFQTFQIQMFTAENVQAINDQEAPAGLEYRKAEPIFSSSGMISLDDVESQSCSDENCASCPSDRSVCSKCATSYNKYGNRCLDANTVALLTMDNSDASIDHYFLEGGSNTLQGLVFVDGVTGKAVVFEADLKLQLASRDMSVSNFYTSIRFYPTAIGSVSHILTVNNVLYVDLLSSNSIYQLNITYGSAHFLAPVEIQLNEWNNIAIAFKNDIWEIEVNLVRISAGFTSSFETNDASLEFGNWYLGAESNGMVGYVDEFIMRDYYKAATSASASSSRNKTNDVGSQTWFIVLIVILAIVIVAVVVGYAIYYRKQQHDVYSTGYTLNQD